MSEIPVSESTAIQVIEAVCDKLGIVADWANTNVVPYAQELINKYMTYVLVSKLTQFMLSVVLVCVLCTVVMYCNRQYKAIVKEQGQRYKNNEEVKFQVIGTTCAIAAPFVFVLCLVFLFGVLKAFMIPELYILDLIKSM